MSHPLRIAMAQVNVAVGAISENSEKIAAFINRARKAKANLVLFPELAITGYPPEDLLFKSTLITDNLMAVRRLASSVRGLTAVVGFVDRDS